MKYSATTGNFYPDWGDYLNIPSGAVEVSESDFNLAMAKTADQEIKIVNGSIQLVDKVKTKDDKIKEISVSIKAEYDIRKYGGVLYDGDWYPSDSESIAIFNGLTILGGVHPVFYQNTLNGKSKLITQPMAIGIVQAYITRVAALDIRLKYHLAESEKAADIEEYDYSTGWPEKFTG